MDWILNLLPSKKKENPLPRIIQGKLCDAMWFIQKETQTNVLITNGSGKQKV